MGMAKVKQQIEEKILRWPALQQKVGLSRSTVLRLENQIKDPFPRRIRLTNFTVGWVCSEVDMWLARRKKGVALTVLTEFRPAKNDI